jgi:hypothetical protein
MPLTVQLEYQPQSPPHSKAEKNQLKVWETQNNMADYNCEAETTTKF